MQHRYVTISRPIWVKGKGLPKNGVCLFNQSEKIKVIQRNGCDLLLGNHRGKPIEVATILVP
jgi:hypothetical protein